MGTCDWISVHINCLSEDIWEDELCFLIEVLFVQGNFIFEVVICLENLSKENLF